MSSLNDSLVGAVTFRQLSGSGKPYFWAINVRCIAQVLLLGKDVCRRYLIIANILLCGLDHTLKKSIKTSLWICPSIGSSPNRKWRAGILLDLLRIKIPRRIFLWKMFKGARWELLRAKEDNPDLMIGLIYVLMRWYFKAGLRRHLLLNAGPRRLKIAFLPFDIRRSTFLRSWSTPLTIWPKCSLSVETSIGLSSKCHGEMSE